MKKIVTLLLFFLSFSSFAADINQKFPQENFIIAKINNKAITNSELLDRYRFVIAASKIKIATEEDKKLLLNQILDKMIDEELIRQESASLKLEVTPEEMREAIDIVAAQQKKNATQFKLFFNNNSLSFDNYLKQMESEILWSKIISEILRSRVKVTDVEVREFFEQHKFNTDIKKFFLAEILISNTENTEKFASKLLEELKRGADFRNIARQFSTSVTAENNGEIGWVSQADIDPKIYAAIHKLRKGEYSNPVNLNDGYRIFKLLDVKVETHINDQDLNSARNAIFSNKLQTVAKGYSMDLRKKSFVEISR